MNTHGNGNDRMRIVIVAEEPFPAGMAATNRILSLARGFVEHGVPVRVVLLRAFERGDVPPRNPEWKGRIHGIDYEYACGTTVSGETFLRRRYLRLKAYGRAVRILVKVSRGTGRTVLLLYLRKPHELIFFYLLTRLLGMTLIQDKSEYPFVDSSATLPGRIYRKIYDRVMFRVFDGMFVMTGPLREFFRGRIRRSAGLLHVPMTVEASRFRRNGRTRTNGAPYIAYCGYVGGEKDGVPILLRAFSLVARTHPEYRLLIIGDAPDSDDLDSLKRLAGDLGVGEKVVFTGRVHRDEIPGYLCNASLLALARPYGRQSEGGFPTKLGEYLATGNPVAVTAVGDIPLYLHDGENAFIAAPDSAEAFAEKIDLAISDPEGARRIGMRGRETALAEFDHHTQAGRALAFLEDLGR